ncbi:MAG: type I-U CRISPR-associated helicase/endonuclease Cas3 [Dermatophilaceae bacterium]
MLSRCDFVDFFAAINGGNRPFAWQQRLLDHVLSSGQWPDEINAPTGAGKSSVVDIHVFANALYAVGQGPRVPRRLAVVVNRRALVDHHYLHAHHIADALAGTDRGLLAEVASALSGLTEGRSPALELASIRGGVRFDREWLRDPRACAVIAATPDMWGSRVLFSAYGTSRRARPREAGLLAMDAVVVLDEAHLNQQVAATARDVECLTRSSSTSLGVPSLQVVSTTATPSSEQIGDRVTIGVTLDDIYGPDADAVLVERLTRPKPVNYHASPHAPLRGKASPAYVSELASLAMALRSQVPADSPAARTVGCIVNHVDTAARVADHLRKSLAAAGEEGEVVCWVGRMRPMDLEQARARHPGLFSVKGDRSVAFLVTTQTAEVGIDLDLAGLVTELAPSSALAQRGGRVNRLGVRPSAHVVVVGPTNDAIGDRKPYDGADLRAAYEWVQRLMGARDVEEGQPAGQPPLGMAPIRLTGNLTPPAATPRRPVFTRVTPADAARLAETSQPPFAEPDLAFWLRDDLAAEVGGASLVVRAPLPEADLSALALIRATMPDPAEMFPAAVYDCQAAIERILRSEREGRARAFLVRGEELTLITEAEAETFRARPGDVFVIDDGHPLTLTGVVVTDPAVPAEAVETAWGAPRTEVWFAPEHSEAVGVLGDIWAARESDDDPSTQQALADAAAGLAGYPAQVTLAPDALWEDQVPPWVVLQPVAALLTDGSLRQEWSPGGHAVLLDDHSAAVGARAAQMAAGVGLRTELQDAVCRAGLLHDAGKADVRFQRERLGWRGGLLLAKSGGVTAQTARRRRGLGLLPGLWRHEQLSAAVAHGESDLGAERELVIRLVGTSHGHGRPFFPHGADALIGEGDCLASRTSIAELFTNGSGWSDILDSTHRRFGVWGCAYLEAILRAADCQVSQEGS